MSEARCPLTSQSWKNYHLSSSRQSAEPPFPSLVSFRCWATPQVLQSRDTLLILHWYPARCYVCCCHFNWYIGPCIHSNYIPSYCFWPLAPACCKFERRYSVVVKSRGSERRQSWLKFWLLLLLGVWFGGYCLCSLNLNLLIEAVSIKKSAALLAASFK